MLQNAAPLPRFIADALGEQCESSIGKMVLDEILQVDVNGEMLCGPAALHVVAGESRSTESERFIARLSRRALEHAAELDSASVLDLSKRLYSYNRTPATARWDKLLRDRAGVESYLGINRGGLATMLDAGWTRLAEARATGWIAWRSKRFAPALTSQTYKLYVSPTCAAVGSVLGSVVETASRFGAFSWKIGGNVHDLLRSDKLVLYFERLTDLKGAAAYLAERIEGCPSQGVPFSAELEARGLLSWGLDPAPEKGRIPWLKRESWRSRICNRLASALILAKTAQRSSISPSRFAALRLRLDGIDTDTWTPA